MGRSFDKGGKSRVERQREKRKAIINRVRDKEFRAETKLAVTRDNIVPIVPMATIMGGAAEKGPRRSATGNLMLRTWKWIKRFFSKM